MAVKAADGMTHDIPIVKLEARAQHLGHLHLVGPLQDVLDVLLDARVDGHPKCPGDLLEDGSPATVTCGSTLPTRHRVGRFFSIGDLKLGEPL